MATDIISGQTWQSKNYGFFSILANNGCIDIDILFIRTGYTAKARAADIRAGGVKDPYYPKVAGRGYLGEGIYKSYNNGKITLAYNAWRNMILRCGSVASYIDCDVCDEWLNYQNFAAWFNDNYTEDYQIDKDLLISGNRTYSPGSCVFITRALNSLMTNCNLSTGTWKTNKERYQTQINLLGEKTHLGTYDTRHQAERVYRHTKATEIVRQALLPSTPKQLFYPLLNKAEELIGNLNRRAK